jgi:hypothetical protein
MAKRSSSARFRPLLARPGVTFPMALEAMHAGEVLALTFIKAAPVWSIGEYPVSPEVASLLLSHSAIEPNNDGLPFDGSASQTWKIKR